MAALRTAQMFGRGCMRERSTLVIMAHIVGGAVERGALAEPGTVRDDERSFVVYFAEQTRAYVKSLAHACAPIFLREDDEHVLRRIWAA